MNEPVHLSLAEVETLCHGILRGNGVSERQATPITRTIVAAERDSCGSHGLYRLFGYIRSVQLGKSDGAAEPITTDIGPAIASVDASRGFAPAAFDLGRPLLVDKARRNGLAALVIRHSHHFSALWAEVEPLAAEDGLAAIAFCPSISWVAPAGGSKPLFGTDPIAFAWPRPGQLPFVFDFATSAVARGEIELRRRAGEAIPEGWALDADGNPTTDPAAGLAGAQLPFGGHKGTALQLMIELLAGAMIEDAMSFEALAADDGAGAPPLHGELILAVDPGHFGGGSSQNSATRAEALFRRFAEQDGARLPSARRYAAREHAIGEGITVPADLYRDLLKLT
ncbi:MAG: Ldh family oxidoreductase [Devosia sp.]